MRDSENGTHVFFDGFEGKGIVYSVLASPFEGGLEFCDAVAGVPPCGSKEPKEREPMRLCYSCSTIQFAHLRKHSYV